MSNVVYLSFGVANNTASMLSNDLDSASVQANKVVQFGPICLPGENSRGSHEGDHHTPTYVSLLEIDSCVIASTQHIIEQQIKKIIAADSAARLDVYMTFEDMSLDFIVLFTLKKSLNAIFKVDLSDVEFSLYSCIATLADHVIDQINQKVNKVVKYRSDAHRNVSLPEISEQKQLFSVANRDQKVVSIFKAVRAAQAARLRD